MVCDGSLLRSSPSLGEVLHGNQSNIHFDPQLLGSWVVMNIINGIAREDSPGALVPPSLAPRGANAVGEEHLRTWHVPNHIHCNCVLLGEKIQGLKGFYLIKSGGSIVTHLS